MWWTRRASGIETSFRDRPNKGVIEDTSTAVRARADWSAAGELELWRDRRPKRLHQSPGLGTRCVPRRSSASSRSRSCARCPGAARRRLKLVCPGGQIARQQLQLGRALRPSGSARARTAVEVIFDDALVAAGHENEVLDAAWAPRPPHSGSAGDPPPAAFLRHRLGGGRKRYRAATGKMACELASSGRCEG